MSGSPGYYLSSRACSKDSPAFKRRLVMAASEFERSTPSQSPALAIMRLSFRITAVKAQDPTVL